MVHKTASDKVVECGGMAAAKIEDLNLPGAVVLRLIKDSLPDGVSVAKDARLAIGRAASMFILYLTDLSNRIAVQNNRKTVHGNDILKALAEGEFTQFIQPLAEAMQEYKKQLQTKKQKTDDKPNGDCSATNEEVVSDEELVEESEIVEEGVPE